MSETIDENVRKYGFVLVALAAGVVAWFMYGHKAEASNEPVKYAASPLQARGSPARVVNHARPVVSQENTGAQEEAAQAVDDNPPEASSADAAQPVAAAPEAAAASPSTAIAGALSFNVNGRGLNSLPGFGAYRYRGFGDYPGYRAYGGYHASRGGGFNRAASSLRGGARSASSSRGAVRSFAARSLGAVRSFGGRR